MRANEIMNVRVQSCIVCMTYQVRDAEEERRNGDGADRSEVSELHVQENCASGYFVPLLWPYFVHLVKGVKEYCGLLCTVAQLSIVPESAACTPERCTPP